jgi:hypothetical protein
MTFDAKAVGVMVASPSDAAEERAVVRQVLAEWNDLNALNERIVLLPLMWESHSAPILAGRPQQIINDTILIHADIVVGILKGKIGSPTGKARSGTLEEIQEHHKLGKPVMVYFASEVTSIDARQRKEVERFKAWAMKEGLIGTFSSAEDFKRKLERQIPLILASPYSGNLPARDKGNGKGTGRRPSFAEAVRRSGPILSKRSRDLLDRMSRSDDGRLTVRRTMSEASYLVSGKPVLRARDLATMQDFDNAVKELVVTGLARCESNEINQAVYSVITPGSDRGADGGR